MNIFKNVFCNKQIKQILTKYEAYVHLLELQRKLVRETERQRETERATERDRERRIETERNWIIDKMLENILPKRELLVNSLNMSG